MASLYSACCAAIDVPDKSLLQVLQTANHKSSKGSNHRTHPPALTLQQQQQKLSSEAFL